MAAWVMAATIAVALTGNGIVRGQLPRRLSCWWTRPARSAAETAQQNHHARHDRQRRRGARIDWADLRYRWTYCVRSGNVAFGRKCAIHVVRLHDRGSRLQLAARGRACGRAGSTPAGIVLHAGAIGLATTVAVRSILYDTGCTPVTVQANGLFPVLATVNLDTAYPPPLSFQ